jgi:hypothetical protein
LTLAIALPLAVGACVALHGAEFDALAITGAVFGGIVLAVFGCAMALDDCPKYAIAAIIALPPTLLLYFPLLELADLLPIVRVAMGIVAIALVGFLAKGALPRSKSRPVSLTRRVVHLV